MRKIILLLILAATISSCRTRLEEKIYSKWMATHLISNNKDLLNNYFGKDFFDVPYSKTEIFGILENPKILIIYFSDKEYINAEYKIINNKKIEIISCEKKSFIGEYDLIFNERRVEFPDIEVTEYNLILKSLNTTFYLKRYVPISQ